MSKEKTRGEKEETPGEYWDRVYKIGHSFVSLSGQLIEKIRSFLPNEGTILELGCGEGGLAGAFQQLGYSVTGYDTSVVAILRAKERYPGAKYLVTNAELHPLHSVDIILMKLFLAYVREKGSFLKRISEACQYCVVITLVRETSEEACEKSLKISINRDELEKLFSSYKYEKIFGFPSDGYLLEAYILRF